MAYRYANTFTFGLLGGVGIMLAVPMIAFFMMFVVRMISKLWSKIVSGTLFFFMCMFLIVCVGERLWWMDAMIVLFGAMVYMMVFEADYAVDKKKARCLLRLALVFAVCAVGMFFVEGRVCRSNFGEEMPRCEEEISNTEVNVLMRELVSGEIDVNACEFIYMEREDAEIRKTTISTVRMNNNYFSPREDVVSEEIKYTIKVPLEAEKYLSALR